MDKWNKVILIIPLLWSVIGFVASLAVGIFEVAGLFVPQLTAAILLKGMH